MMPHNAGSHHTSGHIHAAPFWHRVIVVRIGNGGDRLISDSRVRVLANKDLRGPSSCSQKCKELVVRSAAARGAVGSFAATYGTVPMMAAAIVSHSQPASLRGNRRGKYCSWCRTRRRWYQYTTRRSP
jgi:hypothetical protein